jgi:hypothetical protein
VTLIANQDNPTMAAGAQQSACVVTSLFDPIQHRGGDLALRSRVVRCCGRAPPVIDALDAALRDRWHDAVQAAP